MSIANIITIVRLFIAASSFVLMMMDHWIVASVLLLVAVLLDVADGKMARRMNQVTKQGVFLDVMADKIVIISTFLIIGIKLNSVFFYLGILMLFREYIMDTMRSIAASQSVVISADKFSKIKGVMFMVAMIGMIFNRALYQNDIYVQFLMVALGVTAMVLAYVTLVRFFIRYRDLMLFKK